MTERLRAITVALAATLALSAPAAAAETALTPAPAPIPASPAPETTPAPTEEGGDDQSASQTAAPAPTVQRGDTLTAPEAPSERGGGVTARNRPSPKPQGHPAPTPDTGALEPRDEGDGAVAPPVAPPSFLIPSIPSSTCSPGAVPPVLVPIYQRASNAYGLGPDGPSVLAAINLIETAFGTNLNVSSAGAVGWMQFMPETWDGYGVDANGDGVRDPYDPEDAIFAAAGYLQASGAPADWYGAIYAYNHADWYVADVLTNAECYGRLGSTIAGAFELTPKLQVLECRAAPRWRKRIPAEYLAAFESAAARYGLDRRGVWALAAVARLESNFGRGMTAAELKRQGPLGLDGVEWRRFTVDGDGDGRIRHEDPDDSAATLARLIWSRGSLRAGLFSHNQAKWYVDAVLAEATKLQGRCRESQVDWALALPNVVMAPINWQNLAIVNQVAREDLENGLIDPRIVGLIGAITQGHQIVISSLRSDHSMLTASGGVSNHYFGRAMDIAVVDGVSCTDTSPSAPCAELARTLANLPAPAMPTELIYCFDVDGPGPAFARSDHCDHVHAGYDG